MRELEEHTGVLREHIMMNLDDLLTVLFEDDANCRQREEADSLEHREDDGGASGMRVLANGFSVAFVDNSAKRLSPLTLRRKSEKMIPEWMKRKASAYGYSI